jgi:hypothetical protein
VVRGFAYTLGSRRRVGSIRAHIAHPRATDRASFDGASLLYYQRTRNRSWIVTSEIYSAIYAIDRERLVLRHSRRELLWLGVTTHPSAIARQLTEACGWSEPPRYREAFVRRLTAMGIWDRPISARSPWQNGLAEWLIGSIRRDCLDHVVIFGEQHLRHFAHLIAEERRVDSARR